MIRTKVSKYIEKEGTCIITYINNKLLPLLFRKSIFISPLPYAIGNFSEEVRYALIQQTLEQKKLFILVPSRWTEKFDYRICNIELANTCREYTRKQYGKIFYYIISITYDVYFSAIRILYLRLIRSRRSSSKKADIGINYLYSFPRFGISDMWNIIYKADINSDKYDRNLNMFRDILSRYIDNNINVLNEGFNSISGRSDDIWVIHTRSGDYYKDGNRRNRNMNILNYEEGIKDLLKKHNKRVYLIGDKNNMTLSHTNFMNIPNTYDGDEQRAIELCFIAKCNVYLGTQSGPWDLALLLGKNILCINSIDVSTFGIDTNNKAKSWYALKPMKENNKLQNNLIDLNEETQETIFEYCHTADYIRRIIRSYLNNKYIESKSKLNAISQEAIEEVALRLVSNWKIKRADADSTAEMMYYNDEIARLKAKRQMATDTNKKYFYS